MAIDDRQSYMTGLLWNSNEAMTDGTVEFVDYTFSVKAENDYGTSDITTVTIRVIICDGSEVVSTSIQSYNVALAFNSGNTNTSDMTQWFTSSDPYCPVLWGTPGKEFLSTSGSCY